MSIGSHRLVGFAFASADLLMEVAASGTIPFAMGASEALSGSSETALVGRAWRDFVDPADHAMLASFFMGLEPGTRAGPLCRRTPRARWRRDTSTPGRRPRSRVVLRPRCAAFGRGLRARGEHA